MNSQLSTALVVQISHIVLCIIWNLTGIYQISHGVQPIGPTASSAGAVVLLLLGVGLLLSARNHWIWSYLVISLLPALGAFMAIYGGFVKDATLWPSVFWQYAGILINAVGIAGFLLAIRYFKRSKREA